MLANKNEIVLTEEFNKVLDLMENTQEHIFLTGRAGTGKSTLLKYFLAHTAKNVVVVAPTGIAAINVGGQTIHSFFGFPPYPVHPDHIRKRKNRKLYQSIDTIVIDEISMVRADLLDGIDYFMRINSSKDHRSLPFGGVQMIFIGDLFQLPPVVATEIEKQLFTWLYDTPFFYSANCLYDIPVNYFELTHVFRQKDRSFLSLLDAIRTKEIQEYELNELNSRYNYSFRPEENKYYITLAARNRIADRINNQHLNQLETPIFYYEGEITGDFDPKAIPNDIDLSLRVGAQVMFIKNDVKNFNWVNGTIGKVIFLDNETVSVKVVDEDGEKVFNVEREQWDIVKYIYNEEKSKIDTKIIGTFKQYPLKFAWAITIHKSQGKTFERVIIDIGRGAFSPGQIYVALSRCTTLEGIVLRQPIRYRDIIVDERVVNFSAKKFRY